MDWLAPGRPDKKVRVETKVAKRDGFVVALGDACVDVYSDGRFYISGNVVDTGVHLQRLGVPTAIVTSVGTDTWGDAFVEQLGAEGIDISHLHVLDGRTAVTQMSMDGLDRVHGDYDEGVLAEMTFSDSDLDLAKSAQLVHSALWGNADHLLRDVKGSGTLVSFDFADRIDHPLVTGLDGAVDYGFFSFPEPSEVVDNFLKERVSKGMRVAVATFGTKGSRAFDGDRFCDAGIVPAEVVNTVGAGDSYIAGFLAEVVRGHDIPSAMNKGAEVAADVVATFAPWPPLTDQ